MSRWRLEGRTLYFSHPKGDLFWQMPEGFRLPAEATLSLATWILLNPYGDHDEEVKSPTTSRGERVAIAYSGGVDSSAAYELLPDPIPIYTQVANPSYSHKTENALLALRDINGIAVVSNSDQLPTYYGRRRGVFGFGGFTITSVLLSDFLNVNVVADGNIIDFVYLRSKHGHGTKYFLRDHSGAMNRFAKAGISYCAPCAGLSEIMTSRIASNHPHAMGCMRGVGGLPCGKCVKCYRKSALNGNPLPASKEVEALLEKEWIPVLADYLYARDKHGLHHPRLDGVIRDYSWVSYWYSQSIEYIPVHLRGYFLEQLDRFGIPALEDEASLRAWSANVGPVPPTC